MNIFLSVKKYLHIYWIFIKNCVISSMEYRANFIAGIISEVGYLFPKMLYITVVYSLDIRVNGLTPDSILLFIGTYTFITGMMSAHIFSNYVRISGYVRDGSLDMYITKPISLQFMTTLRYVDFSVAIPNIIGGIIMIVVAWQRLGITASFLNVIGYSVLVFNGLLVSYAVIMCIALLAFWIVNAQSIMDIVVAFWDFNTMPMGIYGKWMKRVGIYIIPIFVISNFPCLFLLKQMSLAYALWSFAVPVISLVILRLFWKVSIRNYSSASS